jgi:hypothetical protein
VGKQVTGTRISHICTETAFDSLQDQRSAWRSISISHSAHKIVHNNRCKSQLTTRIENRQCLFFLSPDNDSSYGSSSSSWLQRIPRQKKVLLEHASKGRTKRREGRRMEKSVRVKVEEREGQKERVKERVGVKLDTLRTTLTLAATTTRQHHFCRLSSYRLSIRCKVVCNNIPNCCAQYIFKSNSQQIIHCNCFAIFSKWCYTSNYPMHAIFHQTMYLFQH